MVEERGKGGKERRIKSQREVGRRKRRGEEGEEKKRREEKRTRKKNMESKNKKLETNNQGNSQTNKYKTINRYRQKTNTHISASGFLKIPAQLATPNPPLLQPTATDPACATNQPNGRNMEMHEKWQRKIKGRGARSVVWNCDEWRNNEE